MKPAPKWVEDLTYVFPDCYEADNLLGALRLEQDWNVLKEKITWRALEKASDCQDVVKSGLPRLWSLAPSVGFALHGKAMKKESSRILARAAIGEWASSKGLRIAVSACLLSRKSTWADGLAGLRVADVFFSQDLADVIGTFRPVSYSGMEPPKTISPIRWNIWEVRSSAGASSIFADTPDRKPAFKNMELLTTVEARSVEEAVRIYLEESCSK